MSQLMADNLDERANNSREKVKRKVIRSDADYNHRRRTRALGIRGAMRRHSLVRQVGLGLLIGFGLFLLGALLEALLNGGKIGDIKLYIDDVLIGLIAGGVVFWYEQRRHRLTIDKLRVIAEMNHHVRNALQSLALVPYAEQSKQVQIITESTQRIQWALQEILPGEIDATEVQKPWMRPRAG